MAYLRPGIFSECPGPTSQGKKSKDQFTTLVSQEPHKNITNGCFEMTQMYSFTFSMLHVKSQFIKSIGSWWAGGWSVPCTGPI